MTETVHPDLAELVGRALDRDLARANAALTRWPHPDASQRVAIAEHVRWMARSVMQQGGGADVIDRLTGAAEAYGSDGDARPELVAALDACSAAGALELQTIPAPPSNPQRAAIACWLDDEATDAERAMIGTHFSTRSSRLGAATARRAYRRVAYRRWYLPQHSGLNRHLSCDVSVDVGAPVEAVWQVVADPTRTPEWSHECHDVEFIDGATEPGLGVKFAGANRNGRTTWSRTCTIFVFDEPREFGYLTSGAQGDATAWHFRLDPTETGTKLRQAYQIVAMARWMSFVVGVLLPSHDDRADALRADLVRLGALAEQGHQRASPA